MPQTKVVDLLGRAAETLQDQAYVRWTKPDLLGYLNDAQRQLVIHRPDANPKHVTFICVQAARQSLPADGHRLLRVRRNVGGRAITPVSQDDLDLQLPNWHEAPPTGAVEHYVYDPVEPKSFYLYPNPLADHEIEIVYSAAPDPIIVADFDTDTQVIGVDDLYVNVISDYMLFRAYQKEGPYGDLQRATLYLQAFNSALGVKTQVDAALMGRASR